MKKLTILERIKLYFINRSYKKAIYKLNNCDYKLYLNSDHWKFFAQEKRKETDFKCELCHNKGIEIHHKSYEHRGYETFNDVLCLCHDCHFNKIHGGKPAHLDSRFKI